MTFINKANKMYQSYTNEEKENLQKYSALLNDFAQIGMNVLTEAVNQRELLRTDLASYLFFRQIIEMADASSELIKIGCVNSAKPLLRTLLESYFQLLYLLKDNEERKALQFLYHYEKNKRTFYEMLAYPNKSNSFFERLNDDKHLKGEDISDEQKEIYIDNIRKIDETLSHSDYNEVSKEYLRVQQNKKVKQWYELFHGPKNVYLISKELEEVALYEFIYRECSSYSHSEDIVHSNFESLDEEHFGISFLRDVRQLSSIANHLIMLVERSILNFLKNKVKDQRDLALQLLPSINKAKSYRKEM